jgi:catechol 2,3-dioxygenase-like lactoylglutathione lyase family enzyme
MSLPIRAIHHVSLRTANLDASLVFYQEVVGAISLPRPPFSFRGAWLAVGGIQIHLIEESALVPEAGEISTRADHVAFHVDDLAAAEAELTAQHVPYVRNVQAGTGTVQIFFHDPDGHTLELAQYPSR